MKQKKYKIIMLPVVNEMTLTMEEKAELLSIGEWGLGYGYQNGRHQHLYVLSDDNIDNEDWMLNMAMVQRKEDEQPSKSDGRDIFNKENGWFKIIVSTNRAITPNSWIPDSYVQWYSENSQKLGAPFDYILLEVKFHLTEQRLGHAEGKFFISTNEDCSIIVSYENELLELYEGYDTELVKLVDYCLKNADVTLLNQESDLQRKIIIKNKIKQYYESK